MTVQQHQSADGAQIAQTQRVAGIVVLAIVLAARAGATDKVRQLVQGVGNIGGGGRRQLIGGYRGDRRRLQRDVGDDARAGDRHRFGLRALRIRGAG